MTLLKAVQNIDKRAERVSDDQIINTYVDSDALISALMTKDNGTLYGRRGTGKTHALKYLAETERTKGNFVLYIDMEQDLGSTEGLYIDQSLSVPERATRLLVDVLALMHDKLLEDAFAGNTDILIEHLERAMDHFSEIVVGDIETETSGTEEFTSRTKAGIDIGPEKLAFNASIDDQEKVGKGSRYKVIGKKRYRVHFGGLAKCFRDALIAHQANRIWVLLDEWSGLPLDLQPYLAEMLRRIFFSLPKVTVRIAAIPHRTVWRISSGPGDYIGLEIGSELFPLLDLDEFVVFPARNREEQTARATKFYRMLIHRHVSEILRADGVEPPDDPDKVLGALFTQATALTETIRAAEGVPRDALSIIGRAALRAGGSKIATNDVRDAAAQIYQTTKAAQLNATPAANALLQAIIADVISTRKARAFLLRQNQTEHPLIQKLADDRILHIIKRGYSSKDDAGERFDVLQIDYGCYVHLLKTKDRAPQGMLALGDISDDKVMEIFYSDIEVPEEDYRAIRRAVLDLPHKLAELGITDGQP
jgi:hypothetical protein